MVIFGSRAAAAAMRGKVRMGGANIHLKDHVSILGVDIDEELRNISILGVDIDKELRFDRPINKVC